MRQILLIATAITLASCENSKLTNTTNKILYNFDFSYDSGWGISYSLKFTNSDTIFLGNGRRAKKYFLGYINSQQRQKLDSFIIAFSKQKWDTAYIEKNIVDQSSYQFYLATDTSLTKVFNYGDTAPRELQLFCSWLVGLKDSVKFQPIDTTIKFSAIDNFYPPIPPPIKITPPKKYNSR